MTSQVSVGIAGLGYWGPNLLRNFRSIDSCRVTAMSDLSSDRLLAQSRLYPDIRCVESADALIEDDSLDALVFALPAGQLPDLAMRAIKNGKHVMVEKPMAPSLSKGREMLSTAEASGLVTMADFTFIHSPPVRRLKALLQEGNLGNPHYYQSTRINLGRFQPDVDVIWDLVVHDASILLYLFDRVPATVNAMGRGLNERVDTAHVSLVYQDGLQAFIHVSWMAPMKVRMSLLACDRGMVLYDDVQPDEKIRVYQVEGQFDPETENSLVPTFRLGDVYIPRLPQEEALRNVASSFIGAIQGENEPLTDWMFGVRVLSVLEAARESLLAGHSVSVEDVGS